MDASVVGSRTSALTTLGGPPLRGRRQRGQAEPVSGHRVVRDPPEDDLDGVREGEDSQAGADSAEAEDTAWFL